MNIKSLKTSKELPAKILKFIKSEEIDDLTESGLCPHYRLINPKTRKEIYLYNPDEVYKWMNENLTRHFPSRFEPEITIFQYNERTPDIARPTPPRELAGLKNLMHLPFVTCATPPGIYFLIKDDVVVYVGQSANVLNRIMTHVSEKLKEFDNSFFIPVGIDHLDKVEQAFIKTLRPIYNLNNGPTREHHIEVVNSFKDVVKEDNEAMKIA